MIRGGAGDQEYDSCRTMKTPGTPWQYTAELNWLQPRPSPKHLFHFEPHLFNWLNTQIAPTKGIPLPAPMIGKEPFVNLYISLTACDTNVDIWTKFETSKY